MLATPYAVIAGIAYNALPFTALPLYVALERIDGGWWRRRETFTRASGGVQEGDLAPFHAGLFAAFLLTFIPAAGDYVNAKNLGGTTNTMIGTIIQHVFLMTQDYPGGPHSRPSHGSLIGILLYARLSAPAHRGVRMRAATDAAAERQATRKWLRAPRRNVPRCSGR